MNGGCLVSVTPAMCSWLLSGINHRSVGIVQQIQLKKAKKMQEDILAEEQKLQLNHLAKLRRAAAAEVAGDTAAKACTLGWLHGGLGDEEQEHLDHWMGLLTAVLDLQQQQQEDQNVPAEGQQQQGVAPPGLPDDAHELKLWIKQPENFKHHPRMLLECLKELGAVDLPARVLLTCQV